MIYKPRIEILDYIRTSLALGNKTGSRANALYKVYAKMLAPSHKTEVKSARYRA